ncbi:MAG TPA: class I SAM-dependent methyltransferase [Bryobacteraceae bacterium]|nr:class I SAM-dependent methyltransferase [Bryobacteraceae bacterium]
MPLASDSDQGSVAYYEENADQFVSDTLNVDMSELHRRFLDLIPRGGRILDAGCGSGRDSKAFLNAGYEVVSIDASSKMVAATSALTGHTALKISFQEMSFVNEFDGIWACASLLHVPRSMLAAVLLRLEQALKPGGHLYMSFKYGDSERVEAGRCFNDLNEYLLRDFVGRCLSLRVILMWTSPDARPGRPITWLNAISQKDGSIAVI